ADVAVTRDRTTQQGVAITEVVAATADFNFVLGQEFRGHSVLRSAGQRLQHGGGSFRPTTGCFRIGNRRGSQRRGIHLHVVVTGRQIDADVAGTADVERLDGVDDRREVAGADLTFGNTVDQV